MTTVRISPSKGHGTVMAPPSKSMAHRMLICAGLSKGKSIVHGIAPSQDVEATINCLQSLGADCKIDGDTVTVTGIDAKNALPKNSLSCRESGSTLRFFIPIAMLSGNNVLLAGSESLFKRPLSVYETICEEDNLTFLHTPTSVMVKGPIRPRNYRLPGNISSQFISGLLFALPLLSEDSTIQIVPPIESRSYIELTISSLKTFGVNVYWKDENTLYIPGSQEYEPQETTVEGDYSNAAFYAALNALGSDITVKGLNPESLQGDKVYEKHITALSKGTPTIHLADCPDLGPILFGVAAAKYGGVFTGTKRLRIKESDRALAMATELKKFGVDVAIHEDSVVVYPRKFEKPTEPLDGHNDHRIVMTMAVLASITGGEIVGSQAVSKSYPDFFERIKDLGIEVETHDI